MKVTYPGRGLGIFIARRMLRAFHRSNLDCLRVSKTMLQVEAIPRIMIYHGLKGLCVDSENAYNIVDSLGNVAPVNIEEETDLHKYIATLNVKCNVRAGTCVDQERAVLTRNVLACMKRLNLTREGGVSLLHSCPAPGEVVSRGPSPEGATRLMDETGWEAYTWKARPYTLLPIGPHSKELTLRRWSGPLASFKGGLRLAMQDEDILLQLGRMWWRLRYSSRPYRVYMGGGYARILSETSTTLCLNGSLLLEIEGDMAIEAWNASGVLGCVVDLSRYIVSCGKVSKVLYVHYGIEGVGGIALGPLFNSTVKVEGGKIIVSAQRRSRIRLIPYSGSHWQFKVLGGVLSELFPPTPVNYTSKYGAKPIIGVYPDTVLPLYVEMIGGSLRILLWNPTPHPLIARVETLKPIFKAELEASREKHTLRVFERVVLVPVGALGIAWLRLRFSPKI